MTSFLLGVLNYDENVGQSDIQQAMSNTDKSLRNAVQEVHDHLQMQDQKIDLILEKLYESNEVN